MIRRVALIGNFLLLMLVLSGVQHAKAIGPPTFEYNVKISGLQLITDVPPFDGQPDAYVGSGNKNGTEIKVGVNLIFLSVGGTHTRDAHAFGGSMVTSFSGAINGVLYILFETAPHGLTTLEFYFVFDPVYYIDENKVLHAERYILQGATAVGGEGPGTYEFNDTYKIEHQHCHQKKPGSAIWECRHLETARSGLLQFTLDIQRN